MMDIAYYVIGSLFVIIGFACLVLVVFQMPGTWIMLIIATLAHLAGVFWIMPGMGSSASSALGWWAIGIGCAFALIGEGIEFVAGALGAKAGGGSRRAAWGAILGGFLGAIIGTLLFPPFPPLGTLVGAILGCFMGAFVGETTGRDPRSAADSVKPAIGATIGRVLGTTCKVLIGVVVWVVLSIGLLSGGIA